MTAIIRPESVKVVSRDTGLYDGLITKVLFFGNYVEYEAKVADMTLRIEAPRPQEQEPFKRHEAVGISFDLNSIRILDELPEDLS